MTIGDLIAIAFWAVCVFTVGRVYREQRRDDRAISQSVAAFARWRRALQEDA